MAQTSSTRLLVVEKIIDTFMEDFLPQEETNRNQMAMSGEDVKGMWAEVRPRQGQTAELQPTHISSK